MMKRVRGAEVKVRLARVSAVFIFCSIARCEPLPVFTQLERGLPMAVGESTACKNGSSQSMRFSRLRVFDSREVMLDFANFTFCLGQAFDPPLAFRWDPPQGYKSKLRYHLAPDAFETLMTFLGRADVIALQSSFSDVSGVGDFRVIIRRPAGDQAIDVLGLMPAHVEFETHPVLLHLVCQGEALAQRAGPASKMPDWCHGLRPLGAATK